MLVPKNKFISLNVENFRINVISFLSKPFHSTKYLVETLIYNNEMNISDRYVSHISYKKFKVLHEKLLKEYSNIKLAEFPQKLFDKEEEKLRYIDSFLNTIYEYIKQNSSNSKVYKNLLGTIFDFISDSKTIEHDSLNDVILKKYFKVKNVSIENKEDNMSHVRTNSEMAKSLNLTSNIGNIPKDLRLSEGDKNNKNKNGSRKESSDIKVLKESEWNDVYIKYSNQKFIKSTIKINQQCLQLFKSQSSNNFYLLIPLYKIYFDLYRIIIPNKDNKVLFPLEEYVTEKEICELSEKYPDTTLKDLNSKIIFRLYRELDSFDFIIKFSLSSKITEILSFIKKIKENSKLSENSPYISKLDQTNMNICGNLFIELIRVTIPNYTGKCFVGIELEPYTIKTKTSFKDSEFIINQSFIIPIHNKFKKITFTVYSVNSEGIILKKDVEEKKGEYSIELTELLNNFFPANKNLIISLGNGIKLEYHFKDYTSILALTSKNKNKKIIEDYPLQPKNNEEDKHYTVGTILKRLKRVMILFKEFDDFYTNLFHFQYPIFSCIIMISSIIYFIFCKTQYLQTHILFLVGLIIFCYSKIFNKYIKKYSDMYLFSKRNPYDEESQYVHTKDEEEKKEIQNKNYLIEEKKSSFSFSLKKITEINDVFHTILYKISRILATIEKIKNLFLWTDPAISLYFFVLVLFMILLVYNIEIRFILLFSFTKKFLTGFFFFKRKNINNKEIAEIILKHCYELWAKNNKIKMNFNYLMEVNDEKFKEIIIKNFSVHSEVEISPSLFLLKDKMTIQDIINEVGKCSEMLMIKKTSNLFPFTKESDKIYIPPIEPEDVFYYFITNIKSDYYIATHNLGKDEELKKEFENDDNNEQMVENSNVVS